MAITPSATPPVHKNVDSNGVDMGLATFDFSTPTVSIGPAAPHGLSYNRTNLGGGWLENVAATIAQDSSGYIRVSAGGTSDRFSQSGSTYTNTEGNGATLTFNGAVYVYTNRAGTIANFSAANGQYDRYVANLGWIRDVTFPNVVKWTYQYLGQNYCPTSLDPGMTCGSPLARSVRLQAINSSTGYQLKWAYASNTLNTIDDLDSWQQISTVTAINSSIDYCDPIANSCTFTQSWPKISISRTINGTGWNETLTDATGAITNYTIDGNERLIGVKRPGAASNDISATYDLNGHVSQITRSGVTYNYSWVDNTTANTRTMTRTDPLSHTLTAVSALDTSLVSSVTDENGRTTSYQYDSSYRPTQLTMPEGNAVQYAYDGRGNVTQTTNVAKSGSGLSNIVTSAGFDASCGNAKTCNQPNWTRDAKNNQTDFTYDPTHGGVLTVTQPAPTTGAVRPQARYVYSALQAYYKQMSGGSPAAGGTIYLPSSVSECQTLTSCTGGSDEAKTSIAYGPQVAGTANNLLPVSISSGSGDGVLTATTAFTYDLFGNRQTVDGPLPGTADTSMTRYDADRRVIGQISPKPDGTGPLTMLARRISWNADGTVSKIELGNVNSQSDADWAAFSSQQTVTFGYDGNGRPISAQLSSAGTAYSLTQASYDALGRLQCSAIRMNTAVYSSLPPSACTQGTVGSYGPDQITQNVYDAASQLTQVQVGVGTGAAASERTLTYSANGKLATLKDANNNLSTYVYDGFDRLLQTQYPSVTIGAGTSNAADYNQFAYDPNGNVTSKRNRDGTTSTYAYDALNQLTSKTVPTSASTAAGYSVYYGYDLLGRQTYARFGSPGGSGITNTYDALSRMSSSSSNMDGMSRVLNSAYNLASDRTSLTGDSGYGAWYGYFTTGELGSSTDTTGANIVTVTLDNLRRRSALGLAVNNTTWTGYGFDAVSRLTSVNRRFSVAGSDANLTFAYDPASKITSQSRDNDAYAWNGAVNVNRSYTANGLNQYSAAGPANFTYDANGNLASDGTNSYTYDAENKLVSATSAGVTTSLSYDPLGRLWRVVKGTSETRFLYDGDRLLMEFDGAGNLLRSYVHGTGADEPLVWNEGSGTTNRRFLSSDERGSVVAVMDNSGNRIALNSYDEYGLPGSANQGRFQYTGQAYLTEVGLYYYKARMYSPTLGRFLQTDPIGYDDGPNWYAYAHNDPVNAIDPSGLKAVDPPAVLPVNPGECATIYICVFGRRANPNPNAQPNWADTNLFNVLTGPAPVPSTNEGNNGTTLQKTQPFTCANAMAEKGRITTKTLSVSGVLALGMVGATGTWVNQSTGSHGTFTTFGFGAGIAAGGTLTRPSYSSIGAFTGMSDGFSIGASIGVGGGRLGIGGGYTRSWNDSGSGGGATFDVGSAQLPSFSFAGTWTDTQISNCRPGK